jgi:VWFA-related protein
MSKRIHPCYFAFFFVPGLAFAQQPATPQSPTPEAPALAARPAYTPVPAPAEGRIHLDVVVTNQAGKPVAGLGPQDFTLLDDGRPSKILSFQAIDATLQPGTHPAEVIVLLDAVNEGFQTVARSRDEIVRFLRENGGRLEQPVSVFLLTDAGAKVLLQPSMDGNALAAQLGQVDTGLREVGRSAQDGGIERFELSLKWVGLIAKSEIKRPGRKLLIWAGPGWPLLDRVSFNTTQKQDRELFRMIVDFSTTLREARTTLSSVSLGTPQLGTYLYQNYLKGIKTIDKAIPPDLSLKVLAVQTGGRAIPPDNDLAAQIAVCVQDANTFYTISFDPPRADQADEYHDLKVVIGKPGLAARTTTGYYNQP